MMSFWVVPESEAAADALLLGGDDVERQQPRRRRVDRHRRVHLAERDAVHQRRHVAAVRHRHADLADLAARELVVGVVARLRRQVERYGEPGLALGQVAPVQLVRLRRGGVTRVGADHPRPVALGQAMRSYRNSIDSRVNRELFRSGRGPCPRPRRPRGRRPRALPGEVPRLATALLRVLATSCGVLRLERRTSTEWVGRTIVPSCAAPTDEYDPPSRARGSASTARATVHRLSAYGHCRQAFPCPIPCWVGQQGLGRSM